MWQALNQYEARRHRLFALAVNAKNAEIGINRLHREKCVKRALEVR